MTLPCRIALAASLVFATLTPLPAQSPGGVKAFTGARVIDGTDRAPIDNATIVVRDGTNRRGRPRRHASPFPPAPSASRLTGKTVIPGLVNAHGHVGNTVGMEQGHYSAENVLRDLRTYAAYGVTTVFSLGDDQAAGFAARDAQNDADARPRAPVRRRAGAGAEDARRGAQAGRRGRGDEGRHRQDPRRRQPRHDAEDGAGDLPRRDRRGAQEGLRVAVHLFYLEDAKAVLDAGADFIAHSVRDAEVDDAFVAMLKRRDVCYCPTLMREVSTFVYESTPAWFSRSAVPEARGREDASSS